MIIFDRKQTTFPTPNRHRNGLFFSSFLTLAIDCTTTVDVNRSKFIVKSTEALPCAGLIETELLVLGWDSEDCMLNKADNQPR